MDVNGPSIVASSISEVCSYGNVNHPISVHISQIGNGTSKVASIIEGGLVEGIVINLCGSYKYKLFLSPKGRKPAEKHPKGQAYQGDRSPIFRGLV